jgi:hypothetical protein
MTRACWIGSLAAWRITVRVDCRHSRVPGRRATRCVVRERFLYLYGVCIPGEGPIGSMGLGLLQSCPSRKDGSGSGSGRISAGFRSAGFGFGAWFSLTDFQV